MCRNDYMIEIKALDQSVICSNTSSINHGPWSKKMWQKNIYLSGTEESSPVELLIGADVAANIYTGR